MQGNRTIRTIEKIETGEQAWQLIYFEDKQADKSSSDNRQDKSSSGNQKEEMNFPRNDEVITGRH